MADLLRSLGVGLRNFEGIPHCPIAVFGLPSRLATIGGCSGQRVRLRCVHG